MRIPLLFLIGILVATSGCGRSLTALREEHGEQARRQLSQIEKIVADAEKRDPVMKDFVDPSVEGIEFARQVNDYRQEPGNAQTLLVETWKSRNNPPGKDARPPVCSHWWYFPYRSQSADEDQFSGDDLKKLERDFRILNGAKYVVVIKTRRFVPPRHTFGTSYSLGRLEADAHLYRLHDAKHLGAVRFTAHTSVVGGMGLDFSIAGKDKEKDVIELTRRTYEEAHEMAQARFGELSGEIKSQFQIEVDSHYGHRKVTWKN